eukprot:m.135620 g.135620  ORF g.135620 m.135620 type:complete len:370 (+) comp13980_c0_seq3:792-1901(+)
MDIPWFVLKDYGPSPFLLPLFSQGALRLPNTAKQLLAATHTTHSLAYLAIPTGGSEPIFAAVGYANDADELTSRGSTQSQSLLPQHPFTSFRAEDLRVQLTHQYGRLHVYANLQSDKNKFFSLVQLPDFLWKETLDAYLLASAMTNNVTGTLELGAGALALSNSLATLVQVKSDTASTFSTVEGSFLYGNSGWFVGSSLQSQLAGAYASPTNGAAILAYSGTRRNATTRRPESFQVSLEATEFGKEASVSLYHHQCERVAARPAAYWKSKAVAAQVTFNTVQPKLVDVAIGGSWQHNDILLTSAKMTTKAVQLSLSFNVPTFNLMTTWTTHIDLRRMNLSNGLTFGFGNPRLWHRSISQQVPNFKSRQW